MYLQRDRFVVLVSPQQNKHAFLPRILVKMTRALLEEFDRRPTTHEGRAGAISTPEERRGALGLRGNQASDPRSTPAALQRTDGLPPEQSS